MTAKPLGLPPAVLSTDKQPVTYLSPDKLYRISAYTSGEPHFGHSGSNRFDAPGCLVGSPEFDTCYLGYTLAVAIAESILHDRDPLNGVFEIANTTLSSMYVHRFEGDSLRLLNLTGATLKRLDGHADLAGTCDYDIAQKWSLAVYNNPAKFDGFVYMSRHNNSGKAVLLFDRVRAKLQSGSHTILIQTKGYSSAATGFRIVGI
ncbi:RES family NAD+ phosphorylase [Rugamonas sp. CCM 8940]|uniref:RES family NAD+ phosphorylase n=1 Tax=Rugamonas sp. CCM 8940 TaxID=2765359 RepID=UPI0018F74F03|nr:RES family NAD+ phosphorylase [Rugamonas sp. CCM 8940]MBJ7313719.1 RES family NAD+ phosphorylase [Rugamonas sp. CCM 8940]